VPQAVPAIAFPVARSGILALGMTYQPELIICAARQRDHVLSCLEFLSPALKQDD